MISIRSSPCDPTPMQPLCSLSILTFIAIEGGRHMHWQTHTVFNQPVPLSNSNLFLSDCALREAVAREGAEWDSEFLASIGQQLGTAESLELGRLANANPPELLRYDPRGERLDDVRFHPAWHLLMQGLCANRVHNLAWEEEVRKGAFVARA